MSAGGVLLRCRRWSSCLIVGGALACGLAFGRFNHAAAPPSLRAVLLSGTNVLQLKLEGTSGANYTIESSGDLKSWARLDGGLVENGEFTTQVLIDAGTGELFFRAYESTGSSSSFPTNVALTANTNLSITTLLTTNGASASLYGADGTQITLTIPPYAFPDSQLITMTLVTNVGGLPFSGGLIGAVRLEPDGLDLWGDGALLISLPASLDRRKVSSFAANGDGTEFHLTPDRVTTNGVLIPFAQLGVYGSAIAQLSELPTANAEQFLRSEIQTSIVPARAKSIDLTDCFPGKTDIALLVARNIKTSLNAVSQDMGALIGQARQAQLLGIDEDSSQVLDKVESTNCQFEKSQLQPYYSDAAQNCALAKVILTKVLGIERQRQLLGIEADPSCSTTLSDFPVCAAMQNCLSEIEQCCVLGRKGSDKVAAILGLERQQQLLGLDCLSSSAVQEAMDACTSNAWTGTFTFDADGGTNITENFPGLTKTTDEKFSAHFSGFVTESTEQLLPGAGGFVSLTIHGQLSYVDSSTETTQTAGDCGGHYSVDHSETDSGTNTAFQVSIQLTASGSYSLLALHVDPTSGLTGADGQEQHLLYEKSGRLTLGENGDEQCEQSVNTVSSNDKTLVVIPSPPFKMYSFGGDTNSISDSVDLVGEYTDPPATGHFHWSFQRHKKE